MPRKLQLDALQIEKASLQKLLIEAQQFDDPVGVMQFEQRINEIQEELRELSSNPSSLASVALYFGGDPVIGSRGIAADFAGKILDLYQDLISTAFAKSERGMLGQRGRIPRSERNNTLMVTGLARGSFGFVLDEITDQNELFDTSLKEVVRFTSRLIEGVSALNDQEFESMTDDLDHRTLLRLREFFKILDEKKANIRVVEDEQEFSLDENAVRRGRSRTESTTIEEDKEEEISGTLTGFLPQKKQFEIQGDNDHPYFGAASEKAKDQFKEEVDKGVPVIGIHCRAILNVRSITRPNKPLRQVYQLIEFHSFGESS